MGFMGNFRILNVNFVKISFVAFLIVTFYEIFIKFRKIFNPLRSAYRQFL